MAKQNKKTSKNKANNLVVGIVVILVLCIFVGVYLFIDSRPKNTFTTNDNSQNSQSSTLSSSDIDEQPEDMLDTALTYYADIDIKDYGTITVKLDPVNAPITCTNFVKLANDKFYDGLTFHRIMEDFMMQGGDPLGNGTGGSNETIKGEFSSNGYTNNLSHTRGAISMARSNDPDSASSQFFIVHKDSTFLDGNYAVFGYVTEGIDVVDMVCEDAVPVDNNGTILSNQQPVINSIIIRTE